MRFTLLSRLAVPALALSLTYAFGCSSDKPADYKEFRDEIKKEDAMTDKVMEDNLDDDLNPAEQRAVHEVFEKNKKARERMVEDVFQDQPAGK